MVKKRNKAHNGTLSQTLYGEMWCWGLAACGCLEPGNWKDSVAVLHCPPIRVEIARGVCRCCHTGSRNNWLHTELSRLSKVWGYLPCPADPGHKSQADRMAKPFTRDQETKRSLGVLQKTYMASAQFSILLSVKKRKTVRNNQNSNFVEKPSWSQIWWEEWKRWQPSSLYCSCVSSSTSCANSIRVYVIITSGRPICKGRT